MACMSLSQHRRHVLSGLLVPKQCSIFLQSGLQDPLQWRPPRDVVIEALEIIASAPDPDAGFSRLAEFRSSFFLSPTLHAALEGACEAEGICSSWL